MSLRTLVKALLPYGIVRSYQRSRWPDPAAGSSDTLLTRTTDSYNILSTATFLASLDAARYYERHLLTCTAAKTDLELLTFGLAAREAEGMVLEFGVASGRTINHLASQLPGTTVHGFDSFDGLPVNWRTGFDAGAFAQAMPAVAGNVVLVPGLFDVSLPRFLAEHAEDVSLLHVDCDLYSSTVTIFDALAARIRPGTVIVFDEYFNYPGWRHHEFRAFREFIRRENRAYEYLGFVPDHQQVCVRMTS